MTKLEIFIIDQSDSQILTTKVVPRQEYISDNYAAINAQKLFVMLKLLPFDTIIELGKILKSDSEILQILNIR